MNSWFHRITGSYWQTMINHLLTERFLYPLKLADMYALSGMIIQITFNWSADRFAQVLWQNWNSSQNPKFSNSLFRKISYSSRNFLKASLSHSPIHMGMMKCIWGIRLHSNIYSFISYVECEWCRLKSIKKIYPSRLFCWFLHPKIFQNIQITNLFVSIHHHHPHSWQLSHLQPICYC